MSRKRLVVNTGSNFAVTLLKMVIAFIMTPIMVRNLGNHDYGIWEVVVSLIGYMGLLDVGFRPSVTRNIAYYAAKNDAAKMKKIFSTAVFFMLVLGLVSFLIFVSWAILAPGALAEAGSPHIERYRYLLLIIATQLLFFFPGAIAESTLDGFHRYYDKNNITIINTLIGNFLIWLLITPQNAVLVVAGISGLGVSIKYLIYYFMIATDKKTALVASHRDVDRQTFVELVRFGVKSFVQGVAWRIQQSMDPLLISWVLGPASVVFYALPANLLNYFRTIAMNLSQAFLPLFSEMAAQKTVDNRSMYVRVTRYMQMILTPLALGIVMLGSEFIALWIGPEYGEKGKLVLWALTGAAMLAYLDPLASKYLTAEDKHAIFAKLMPVGVTINIIVTIMLLPRIGVLGAAIGTLLPSVIFSPIYSIYRGRLHDLSYPQFLYKSYGPLLPALFALGISVYLVKSVQQIDTWFLLFTTASLGAVCYFIILFLFGLKKAEKQQLFQLLQKVKNKWT